MNDINTIPPNARVYIYGTGSAGRSLWMWLEKCREDVKVLGFIDSFKKGRMAGKRIYRFDDFKRRVNPSRYELILVASGGHREIKAALEKENIAHAVMAVPSYLMENLLSAPFKEQWAAVKIKCLSLFFKRRLHLFFGEHGGKFIGNNKYFYLYLKEKSDLPVYWVVENRELYRELQGQGIDVLDFREKGFLFTLPRASHFYFDNMTWQRKYPWLRYFKAKIIHMSHGVGLKMTEKMMIPDDFMKRLNAAEEKRLNERIFHNDLLVSTSAFYAENVSAPAYNTPMENITLAGYPKNDLFYRDIKGAEVFSDQETLNRVAEFEKTGHKILVYAPTFRDMDSGFKYADVIDYPEFDRFLARYRLVLVIKGHTGTAAGDHGRGIQAPFSNILFYHGGRDGYPLLKEADLLVTDYSSIYMDFLHHRKPIVFFVYDYHEYVKNHREIQFDYEEMTPGPKVRNYDELTGWLGHFLVEGKDGFEGVREKVFDLAFLYKKGGASNRLLNEVYDIL
jgi:CDP-glycerol glycerophosphotransferase